MKAILKNEAREVIVITFQTIVPTGNAEGPTGRIDAMQVEIPAETLLKAIKYYTASDEYTGDVKIIPGMVGA